MRSERASDDAEACIRSDINQEIGVNWLMSFLSADQKKTYCLYEATSPDAIREQARLLGIPADVIIEVSKIGPNMFG